MIDNLPKYQPEGDKLLCDVCKKKGNDVQPAVMYCTACRKKHCQKHKEVRMIIQAVPRIGTFLLVFLSKVTGSLSAVCRMVHISCAMPIASTQKLLSVLKWLSESNMELLTQFILDSPYKNQCQSIIFIGLMAGSFLYIFILEKPAMFVYRDSKKSIFLIIFLQSHNDLLDGHETLKIEEYQKQSGRLETRMCREHKDQIYSLGCGACLSVFCLACITPFNICRDGKSLHHRCISGS